MSGLVHRMPSGAELVAEGARFRLWAPDAKTVTLLLDGRSDEIVLTEEGDGWRQAIVAEARAGTRYRFRVDGNLTVPDPASRFQPEDVHGPSEVIDPHSFRWQCSEWRGRPWGEAVIYEVHVGTFTEAGTFLGLREKLPYLADLGITAIELMPLADFPGRWDWGYDGVALFAPDASYGRPEDLKALIDAAHQYGLMVFLDVVYNHFGPEGNYLNAYASRFFNPEKHTPWGAAINFDAEAARVVRRFFVDNALYWLTEFAMDGLRFDAVHAIHDGSRPDILEEISAAVKAHLPADRHVHLVLENDKNEARYLARDELGRPRCFVAQWNDDIHHAMHVLLTGEGRGYYVDYADNPIRHLARCLAEGFAYQDDPSAYRAGEPRGELSAHLPPTAFVSFLQNHDQIGNRAFGERLAFIAPPEAVRAGLALLLLSPSPPLLFMGEEWGSKDPFLFFCDFGGWLREAVRAGRRTEFASFPEFADPDVLARIPDPTARETFERSKPDWKVLHQSPYRETLAETQRLLALRADKITPLLNGAPGHSGTVAWTRDCSLRVDWRLRGGAHLSLVANLSPLPDQLPSNAQVPATPVVYATSAGDETEDDGTLRPWSVIWFLDDASAKV